MSDQPLAETPDDILTPLALSVLRQAGLTAYRKLVVSGSASKEAQAVLANVNAGQLFSKSIANQANADATLGATPPHISIAFSCQPTTVRQSAEEKARLSKVRMMAL